ncbi:MAG: hypothetical protein DRG78_23680 [Epsilonproteobacteria bacterium]|nr:MAG: hypothetical protein DRG78_23680 [Campylobacterota bacterium]
MNKLNIKLENCYGINKLEEEFNFTSKKIKNIYAPNGFMKSSLAKVFIDLANGNEPKDEIYSERITTCNVKDENSEEIEANNIFVIESMSGFISSKISTLLVNDELKREYDEIYDSLYEMKTSLISLLYTSSSLSKAKVENEIINIFGENEETLFDILNNKKDDIVALAESQFLGIKYSIIFNDKVKKFLDTNGMQDNLEEYINKYNELIEQSQYLQSNFTHNNVSTISNILVKNSFFSVNNTINLRNNEGELTEVVSEEELSNIIESEKQAILESPELQSIFKRIDDALEKNAELRSFRKLIENNHTILTRLDDIELLKNDFWVSYFKEHEVFIVGLLEHYNTSKVRLAEIINIAKSQETDWQNVVNKFNDKFDVPFKLFIENKSNVILNSESPNVSFLYNDRGVDKQIDDNKLKLVLSNGERRALYILNIIFEIEARMKIGDDTLLIIDDIADSFDYKNKYAIIEYLKEILESEQFYMIVMTHNFDFFRTVASRLNLQHIDCFMTIKNDSEIKLIKAGYLKNVFNHWKTHINSKTSILIASIPFVRNLVEYVLDDTSSEYQKLTALLHIKLGVTENITLTELAVVFNSILNTNYTFGNDTDVLSTIFTESDRLSSLAENNDLENKITLSIAIRLKAEQFMITKISDDTFVNSIESNQTFELFNKYRELNESEISNLKVLGQVNLMTPENIHLNSFMYEPILDMSDRHLIKLYNDVKAL